MNFITRPGDPIAISAMHGLGMDELLDACAAHFPPQEDAGGREDVIHVAVIGKPNVASPLS